MTPRTTSKSWKKPVAPKAASIVEVSDIGLEPVPKLAQNTKENSRQSKDFFGKGGFGGEV